MYQSNQNIKTYHSFKEFSANYDNDLNEWLSLFPDAEEADYIQALQDHYSYWIDYPDLNKDFYNVDKNNFDVITDSIFIIQHKSNFSDYVDGSNYERLSPFEFVSHINNLLTETSENISIDNYSDIVNSQAFIDVIEYERIYNTNDVISFAQLLEFDKNGKLKLDKHKFKNLRLAIPKMQSFIIRKLQDKSGQNTLVTTKLENKKPDDFYHKPGDPENIKRNSIGKRLVCHNGKEKILTLKQVAYICYHNSVKLNLENRDIVAEEYGYTSGLKLKQYVNKITDDRNKNYGCIRKNKNRINDLEIALYFISDHKRAAALEYLKTYKEQI